MQLHHGLPTYASSSFARRSAWLLAPTIASLIAIAPLAVRAAGAARRNAVAQLAVVAVLLVVSGIALRALRLSRPMVLAALAAIAVRFAYLYVTPYSERTHDAGQHVDYIDYILSRHAIPPPSAGWAFYHPPLYYLLSAALWRVMALGAAPRPSQFVALQIESIVFQLGFLAFALLAAQRWLDRLPNARLGARPAVRTRLGPLFAALICLWPSGIIHAVRVGNDDLFYLFFGAALYFVTRWWQDDRARDFHLAAASAALAMLAKSNGAIVFAVLGCLFVARILLDDKRSLRVYLRLAWPGLLMLCVSAGSTLLRAVLDAKTRQGNLLVGNAGSLPHNLDVGNGAANYLWFDVKMFVTQPYTNSFTDDAGRQYFWNFALKTGLFGDFQFNDPWPSNLAVVMSVSFLAVLACTVLGVLRQSRADWMAELPLTLTIGIAMPALAALRMSIPMACSNDFRYVWPILMPSIYLYVRGVARLREAGRLGLAWSAEAAGWSLAGMSLVFISLVAAHG